MSLSGAKSSRSTEPKTSSRRIFQRWQKAAKDSSSKLRRWSCSEEFSRIPAITFGRPKRLRKNNFQRSRRSNGPEGIIPLRQSGRVPKGEAGHLVVGDLDAGGVHSVDERTVHAQAGRSLRGSDIVQDRFER